MNFQIVDRPVFAPQEDILGDTAGPQIDTGVELFGRRIYLGPRVVAEVRRLAEPDSCSIAERDEALERAKHAQARAETAEADNKELRAAEAEYQATRDALTNERAAHAALKDAYARLEAGDTRSAQERLIAATQRKPARKRPIATTK